MDEELQHQPWNGRAIILLDLDAFFASVEQLDHPEWRGKPVIVGGDATRRGVVSTCSYEARAYGIRSAMPASTAARLCPDAIWVPGNFTRYREMSQAVMDIMYAESPFLQQVSIDEAFLDVSPTRYVQDHPVSVAMRIQEAVAQLGITCSIGLGVSKSVAKIASDFDKPQGLTVVYPGRERDFLSPLPTKVMSGIGPVAQERLRQMGIKTLGDIASAEEGLLREVFGKNADMMRARCLGQDTDPVEDSGAVKSLSHELSFAEDLTERKDILAAIATVATKVGRRLRMNGHTCSGIVLKLRFADRTLRSATANLAKPTDNEHDFIEPLNALLDSLWSEPEAIRLVGAAAIHLDQDYESQPTLFDDEPSQNSDTSSSNGTRLAQATDMVRDRFGESAIAFGSEIRTKENLTGSSTKNPADYKKR